MRNCIFCKIVDQEVPATILYENDNVLAFRDIRPQAPIHVLIIPKRHIATLNDVSAKDSSLIAEMIQVAHDLAAAEGIEKNGYRLVINCNQNGGQEVYHIHLHLLGGRQMKWPPG